MKDDEVPRDDELLPEDPAEMLLGAVKFDALSPTAFEGFCFDLLGESGFVNLDWRKGTPKEASPADRGRDIVAHVERRDVDGHQHLETWFVDSKHYERAVPPDALLSTIAWANAKRPDVVLFIASGYFSNAAKDWIDDFEKTNSPPFRIRTWEMPQLRRLLVDRMDLALSHGVETSGLRRVSDIIAAERGLVDRLWYGRSPFAEDEQPEDFPDDLWQMVQDVKRRTEEEHGLDVLHKDVETDFNWGMLAGKVSAIRWVLGEEWDFLDS